MAGKGPGEMRCVVEADPESDFADVQMSCREQSRRGVQPVAGETGIEAHSGIPFESVAEGSRIHPSEFRGFSKADRPVVVLDDEFVDAVESHPRFSRRLRHIAGCLHIVELPASENEREHLEKGHGLQVGREIHNHFESIGYVAGGFSPDLKRLTEIQQEIAEVSELGHKRHGSVQEIGRELHAGLVDHSVGRTQHGVESPAVRHSGRGEDHVACRKLRTVLVYGPRPRANGHGR